MSSDPEAGHERTPLLRGSRSSLPAEQDVEPAPSTLSKEQQRPGERLPYNDYTTIDWLHDLVKDSDRYRLLHSRAGLRYRLLSLLDACSGWIAVVVIGALTAVIAFLVDIAVATVADWKTGYCSANPWKSRENCCRRDTAVASEPTCEEWRSWSDSYATSFAIYVALALLFGTISSSATMLTKSTLPSAEEDESPAPPPVAKLNGSHASTGVRIPTPSSGGGKVMYMAAGSGIPEIKTILSGFCIPSFLSLKVLVVKAVGAVFAVSTGMCLGKEGPFVHISTCVGYLVGSAVPKYNENGRKMRELLSAACSSGLSVAFGAPIGGVLFSYEEISTYFPRKVLWRAFLCSLTAAMVLKHLNPTGTGKLILFETSYATDYQPGHYLVFALLGVAGGLFGGLFCKLNFTWSSYFRGLKVIKENPVLEVGIVVLLTAGVQFPNLLTREPGDVGIRRLLVDCRDAAAGGSFVCQHEARPGTNWAYIGWLTYGTLAKLGLTIITFGCKVPSGVIIPALNAGALFGRLVGYMLPTTLSPGIFALISAAAFLAGVSRMTISLAVIMLELSGELQYAVPHMLAILIAKWTADAISKEGVYDLAQTVLGHPFLDAEVAMHEVRARGLRMDVLIPPAETMGDITVTVPASNAVPVSLLRGKLAALKRRGLMDAGLVLVKTFPPSNVAVLQGYIAQSDLARALSLVHDDGHVRLLAANDDSRNTEEEGDLTPYVDTAPLCVSAQAPLEVGLEMFARLGVRYVCLTQPGSGALVGVVIKKRIVGFVEGLRE